MHIDEAIKILASNGLKPKTTTWGEYLEAKQLGYEALKRVKAERVGYETYAPDLLPGETEE